MTLLQEILNEMKVYKLEIDTRLDALEVSFQKEKKAREKESKAFGEWKKNVEKRLEEKLAEIKRRKVEVEANRKELDEKIISRPSGEHVLSESTVSSEHKVNKPTRLEDIEQRGGLVFYGIAGDEEGEKVEEVDNVRRFLIEGLKLEEVRFVRLHT